MSSHETTDAPDTNRGSHLRWFLRGCVRAFSVPALILFSSFVGFGALALEGGLTTGQAVFMTMMVWALPAKVVMVGAIMSGTGLPATALAVGLSSVRLAPMVVTLVPELRGPKTRRWVLYFLSHFVAVTSWVMALAELRNVPRDMRTAWYFGLGATLIGANMIVVAIVMSFGRDLPPVVSAALLLLTPMYFLTSLWTSARERASHVAMVLGLVLGPLFTLVEPGLSLLATGAVGGTAAFLHHRWAKARGAA